MLVLNLYVCVFDVVVGVVDCQVVQVGCGCRRCSCYVAEIVRVDPAVLLLSLFIIDYFQVVGVGPAMITLVSLVLPWC